MAVVETMLIVTVIVSPLAIEGQSATHAEYTREYPQMGIYQCTEQAERAAACRPLVIRRVGGLEANPANRSSPERGFSFFWRRTCEDPPTP